MAPVFQALIALAVGILLCLFLLGQVSLAVRGHSPHMINVILIVVAWVFLRILLQDLDDLATTEPRSINVGLRT